MPYIKKDRRGFENKSKAIDFVSNVGELNYLLTKILDQYLKRKGNSYSTFNDIIGVLECCKLEYYRRRVVPYESDKIEANGDVYEDFDDCSRL